MTARMKILHLGFEDHRRPGSGGGSARNREINLRIARKHDVTFVAARYPGARDRTEDGVRYRHLGAGGGYLVSIVTYFLCLPWMVWRRGRDFDLVVEDFAAPLSSLSVGFFTKTTVIASVQWLNAEEKSRQYRVPLWRLERAGIRSHKNFIAVSGDLAEKLKVRARPGSLVEVIPNGVTAEAFDVQFPPRRSNVLYMGRLEIAQKGLDLLLDAFAGIVGDVDGDLLIAGDGPDERQLRSRAKSLGVGDRVRFLGRLEGEAKWRALASAQVVAMPSRFETFGMVALEAQACGARVAAFEIPCLREVLPQRLGGVLVEPFDVSAFAAALKRCLQESVCSGIEEVRRDFAARYDWDEIAASQSDMYEKVVTQRCV